MNAQQNGGLDMHVTCVICGQPYDHADHRMVSFAYCGHLFGRSCLLRQLGNNVRRVVRCPDRNCRERGTRLKMIDLQLNGAPYGQTKDKMREELQAAQAERDAAEAEVQALEQRLAQAQAQAQPHEDGGVPVGGDGAEDME